MNLIKNNYVQTRGLKNKGKQLTLCVECGDIHYKGFWYASDSQFALAIDKKEDSVRTQQCPACKMLAQGACAGELRITNIPQDLFNPVFLVIRRVAEQDYAQNPQHRILNFAAAEDGYTLTATSAKMISRIRKSVLDMCDECEVQSTYEQKSSSIPDHEHLFRSSELLRSGSY